MAEGIPQVTEGALLSCGLGTAPMPLLVTSSRTITIDGNPVATLLDSAPLSNIPIFACCLSPTQPLAGGAALAAAPPCTPMETGGWQRPSLITTVDGVPTLQQDSMWICGYGGVVQILVGGPTPSRVTGL